MVAKSSSNAIHIITGIAAFGVVVGSLALFLILSGFSGLRVFSDSMLEASDPAIKITAVQGKSFVYTTDLDEQLRGNSQIQAFSEVVEERVFLKFKEKEHLAHIKGVGYNYPEITQITDAVVLGKWLDTTYANTAVIGNGISYKLSLGVLNYGDPLQIYVPKPGKGHLVHPRTSFSNVRTQIIGLYSGSEAFENKFVFTHLALAQELLQYAPNQLTAIELKLQEGVDPDVFRDALQATIGTQLKVETKAQLNALFYKVMNTENLVSYFIFTLIIIIALFNVIGAIIMMIIDKRSNLKTLHNLGVTIPEIKKIFVFQGFLLTFFGMCVGLFLGILLVFLQQQFSLFMITQNIAYPVAFRIENVLIVGVTILVLGYVAASIASSRISKGFVA